MKQLTEQQVSELLRILNDTLTDVQTGDMSNGETMEQMEIGLIQAIEILS